MNNYQMFRKIQEQEKIYEEYDNFDREDLIDELVEEKRINENNLELINKQKEVLDKIKEYCNNRLQFYNEMKRDYDTFEFDGYAENDNENILELLEEIE